MYRVQVEHSGFSPFLSLVEVRSETPLDYRVTLGLTAIETTVQVSDFDTLLDPHRTGSLNYLGADTLRDRRSSQPGRAVLELVDTQPGWLLEANGVLHPRGVGGGGAETAGRDPPLHPTPPPPLPPLGGGGKPGPKLA